MIFSNYTKKVIHIIVENIKGLSDEVIKLVNERYHFFKKNLTY